MFLPRPIFIIIITLFLVLVLGVVLIWPQYQTLKALPKNIKEKEAQLQYKKIYFSELSQIKAELEQYELALSKIDSALPPDLSLPSIFNFLQKASSQSGLVLKAISPVNTSPSEEISTASETKFSISVVGAYSSFKDFLSTLEKSARLIEVENISFSSPSEPSLTFNLRIKVFSY